MQAHVTPFFHASTSTWSYLVRDPASGHAAVIDVPLDFDPVSGELGHASAAAILEAASRDGARVRWILETHAHADHLSAAAWLKERTGAPTAIGAGIVQVQEAFRRKLGLDEDEPYLDAGAFDRLLRDDDELPLGELAIRVIATPGHTPDSVSYLVGDAVFVGDTLSPAATHGRCSAPSGASTACRPRGCSWRTTTRRPAANRAPKCRWPSSVPTTGTSARVWGRPTSSPCGSGAMPACRRRGCCGRRCR